MYNLKNAKLILKALQDAGASPAIIPFLMAQVAHETGNFESRVFVQNNNASGIMFINNPSRQKGATRGLPFPRREQPKDGRTIYYANFATLKDWATDYLRIIGQTPQRAKNLTEFAVLLKRNNYYTAPVETYARALHLHSKKIQTSGILSDMAAGSANFPLLLIGAIVAAYILW